MSFLIAAFWIFLSLTVQILLCNHMTVGGGMALAYLYMVTRTPVEWNRSSQILLGFIVGFIVDMFSNTPGLHALTCVTTMWLRLPLLHVFIVADDIKNGCPTYHRLGSTVYMRFLGFVVLIHCVLLYSFESFTLFNFFNLLSKIVMSVAMTFLLVWAADVANNTK